MYANILEEPKGRADLLVLQDVRERKGSFFTPRKWVELSQEYIARALGENWQDEYVVWDTCAGTGNLLAGLLNKYNVYASTLDKADVDVVRGRIANGAALLETHVFQFDFLNDSLASDKVPQSLRGILADSEKRKRLVIYMNPPYAEASTARTITGTGKNKDSVATETMVYKEYSSKYGTATRELFAQFLIRINEEIQCCKVAHFATLKSLNASNFTKFRALFPAKLMSLFIMPAFTFGNVQGQFPIGFHIWDTAAKEPFKQIAADAYDRDGKALGCKTFCCYDGRKFIIKWLQQYYDKQNETGRVAYLRMLGTDMQHNKDIFISNMLSGNDFLKHLYTPITANNIMECCIYFAVRHAIEHTWINHNDQFLWPKGDWKIDAEFQTNCLAYTLFHGKNRVSARYGVNHWIPFTESEVDAPEKFKSRFMTDFIAGKVSSPDRDLFSAERILHTMQDCSAAIADRSDGAESRAAKSTHKAGAALAFSPAAAAVFEAGRELWRYYMAQHGITADAALYDIREYFQGRDGRGKMNGASTDEKYTRLLSRLRSTMKLLAAQIEPKVYEYGFLK